MTEHWVDILIDGATTERHLAQGLSRLGGPGADIVLPGAEGELHLWSDPPKLIHTGAGPKPRFQGEPFEERSLADGDRIEWCGVELVYRRPGEARVEELPSDPDPAGSAAPQTPSEPPLSAAREEELRLARRVLAGILADLGLAPKKGLRRWQEAIQRGEFAADACARDLTPAGSPGAGDARVLERAARLQRDLVMMPLQRGLRGARRRVRGATRRGSAYVIANLIAIAVYSLVLVAIMVLVRVNYGFSFDQVIDRFLDLFR